MQTPTPPPPNLGMGPIGQKSNFQNMVILHISLKGVTNAATRKCELCPFTYPQPLGRGQKSKYFFLKVVIIHIKLMGMEHRAPCKFIFCTYTNPRPLGLIQNISMLKVVMWLIKLKGIEHREPCKQIQLISLSDCSIYLVTGVRGGKLSRPVCLEPHPPEYQSKFFLLSFLILNYLNVMIFENR